jgi:hypothetical protein
MKLGAPYVRVIILSNMKSGSSFVSNIIGTHPAAFLQQRTLNHLQADRIDSVKHGHFEKAFELIKQCSRCSFDEYKSKSLILSISGELFRLY